MGCSVQRSFIKLGKMACISYKTSQCSKITHNRFWSLICIRFLFEQIWQWLPVIGPLSGLSFLMIFACCLSFYDHFPTLFWTNRKRNLDWEEMTLRILMKQSLVRNDEGRCRVEIPMEHALPAFWICSLLYNHQELWLTAIPGYCLAMAHF